tara:strand:- start:237 stop:1277 length:1041 start_codon:yes stop_codon:yes gene_type:complete
MKSLPGVSQARTALARCCASIGITGIVGQNQGARARILLYHGVLSRVDGPAAFGNLFVESVDFENQLRFLKRAFCVVSLQEVFEMVAGSRPFVDRAIAITLDDGYRNTVRNVLPILKVLDLPATVFIPSNMVGTDRLLWFDTLRLLVWETYQNKESLVLCKNYVIDGRQIKEPEEFFLNFTAKIMDSDRLQHQEIEEQLGALVRKRNLANRYPEFVLADWNEWRVATASKRLSVGAHGCEHEDLRLLSFRECLHILRKSKRKIEKELTQPCEVLAYPYGHYNTHVAKAAYETGYKGAVTVEDGLNQSGENLFALKRTMVGDKGNFYIFKARVSGLWGLFRQWSRRY